MKEPVKIVKAGILGGGQLGRMLLQAAANYPVETFVLENDPHCPSAHLCHHFVKGDINSFDDVYQFGKGLDVITIEIEGVSEGALEKLQAEGVEIFPHPSVLKTIKNKILQKEFYREHSIPTSNFVITTTRAELAGLSDFFPAVHKIAQGGYDGRGVQIIKESKDANQGFDAPAVLEKLIDIKKEIAIILAVNKKGDITMYPAVDMVFDPSLNMLVYQISPADLSEKVFWKAEAIAHKVVKELKSPGIFAVELFLDNEDNVFVNETAPRVHNSGHHSIEACYSSQFDMLWRIMLDYPLGNTEQILPAAMVNIVGEKNFTGPVFYEGLENILSMDNAFVHIYGKVQTKPGRKMGHVTVLGKDRQELVFKANRIRQNLFAKSE